MNSKIFILQNNETQSKTKLKDHTNENFFFSNTTETCVFQKLLFYFKSKLSCAKKYNKFISILRSS